MNKNSGSSENKPILDMTFEKFMEKQEKFKGNPEHLTELFKGNSHWNHWLKDNHQSGKNFIAHLEGANLVGAHLEGANLAKAHLEGASLRSAHLEEAELWSAHLEGASLVLAHLEGAKLQEVHLEGADLRVAHLEEADLYGSHFSDAELQYIYVNEETKCNNTIFNNCILSIGSECEEQQAIKSLSKGLVNNIQFIDTVFGRKVRDEAWLNDWRNGINSKRSVEFTGWRHVLNKLPGISRRPLSYFGMKFMQSAWWVSSDYGRNFFRWATWSVAISVLFAFLFTHLGPTHLHFADQLKGQADFWTCCYYSIVTFTTLGFGDITPQTHLGMFFVALEVILGYIMLGGLISILANKLARRND